MRSIKNIEKLTKEELIIALLKSESNAAELTFLKINNNNNNNNNTDDNINTDDDDTYDDKTSGKISDINMIFSRLGNIVTNKYRKKI